MPCLMSMRGYNRKSFNNMIFGLKKKLHCVKKFTLYLKTFQNFLKKTCVVQKIFAVQICSWTWCTAFCIETISQSSIYSLFSFEATFFIYSGTTTSTVLLLYFITYYKWTTVDSQFNTCKTWMEKRKITHSFEFVYIADLCFDYMLCFIGICIYRMCNTSKSFPALMFVTNWIHFSSALMLKVILISITT